MTRLGWVALALMFLALLILMFPTRNVPPTTCETVYTGPGSLTYSSCAVLDYSQVEDRTRTSTKA